MSGNFSKTIEGKTETYSIMFDYGTQQINVKQDNKIVLNFIHGGFRNVFSRKGNDLVIGDDMYICVADLMGVGYGKEEWNITLNNDGNYSIEIKKYYWQGSKKGYSDIPSSIQTKTLTADELSEFKEKFELVLNEGKNTLYTRWPVLPDPNITYHMNDCAYYAPANGKIILKDYFKYENNEIYVGDRLLSDIIKNGANYDFTRRVFVNNAHVIYDTFLSENIKGKDYSEIIYSRYGDDTIEAGKGNDKIYLQEGNKKIVISNGEGLDTIYSKSNNNSINLALDTDNIFYTKSGNNLIINRTYDTGIEQTKINNFFKNPELYSQLMVTNNDTVVSDNLLQDLIQGNKRITYDLYNAKNKITGSDLSDEFNSSWNDEIFSTGKGKDIIHFKTRQNTGNNYYYLRSFNSTFGQDTINITEESDITLDFDIEDAEFSYAKDGADAIINVTHEVTLKVPRWDISYPCDTDSQYAVSPIIIDYPIIIGPIRPPYVSEEIVVNMFVGSVTLKDYFKYDNNNIYIGNTSLQELLGNSKNISLIDESESRKQKRIVDTFLNDTIIGSRYSDKITSSFADDVINAGRGNDILYLKNGNKTININKGDGKDIINIASDNTSADIVFDDEVDKVSLKKSANNLIIFRKYGNKTESTVINKYFKNNLENDIKIKVGDNVVWDNQLNINAINQNLCLWQANDNNCAYMFDDNMTNYNQIPILVAQN